MTGPATGMDSQTMADTVSEAFVQLHSDIGAMLRQHEASLLRAMADASKGGGPPAQNSTQLHEPHFEPGRLTEIPGNFQEDFNSGTPKREDRAEGVASSKVVSTRVTPTPIGSNIHDDEELGDGQTSPANADGTKSEHWSMALANTQAASHITTWARNSWLSIYRCHHSTVNKLPRLVSPNSRLHELKGSPLYEFFRTVVLIIDAFVVVCELQHASTQAKHMEYKGQGGIPYEPLYLILTDFCFFMMASDLLLMWILEFPHVDFLKGRTRGRRWFNILVIVEQLLQVISQHSDPYGRSMSTFRCVVSQLSVLRLIKAILEVPDIAFRLELGVEEFRIIINSIVTSGIPFMMCGGMFTLFLVIVAVILEEGVLHFLLNDNDVSNHEQLREFFGTLDVTVLTLFKGLFGGDDWGPFYDSLEPLPFYLRYGFLIYICFNFIAVFNIVAAAFIKVAFNKSESDRALLIQKEKRSKTAYKNTMERVFNKLDDGDGKISLSQLADHLKSPNVAAHFSILGIDTREVGTFVKLLDEDGSADINKEEFIFGCMHLKGNARSLDVAMLQRNVKKLGQKITDLNKSLRCSQMHVDFLPSDATQMHRASHAER